MGCDPAVHAELDGSVVRGQPRVAVRALQTLDLDLCGIDDVGQGWSARSGVSGDRRGQFGARQAADDDGQPRVYHNVATP